MLTKFETLSNDIIDLDGTYPDEEMQIKFWRAVKTMEEREWSRYVNDRHDKY